MQFGLIHISAGDLLRAEVEAGTEAGKLAAGYMNNGQLVPNKVVVDMVKHRLAQPDVQGQGWLLDGYPRSADQAAAILEEGIHPDVFLLIQVSHAGYALLIDLRPSRCCSFAQERHDGRASELQLIAP